MKKIYVFGNEYLKEDKLSRAISKHLEQEHDIVHCRNPDELLESGNDEIVILDVVKGIKEPIIINDISQLKTNKMVSLHDFDLGFFLNLIKRMGINKKIKIIGIPAQGNISKIAKQVEAWL